MKTSERVTVLSFAVLMTMCFGANYAWSVAAQELRIHHGFSAASCGQVFGFFQAAFATMMILGGRLIDKVGRRYTAFIGGLLMGLGYFLAGLFAPEPLKLTIFIGILGGGGAGLAYICPMETVQKCFPEKKALVTGISVGGLGIGSLLIALSVQYMLSAGIAITDVFKISGGVFLAVICSTAFMLKTPVACDAAENVVPLPYKKIFTSKLFWALFVAMSVGIFAGQMVISNMKMMGVRWGMTETVAMTGVLVIALFNSVGRIFWGYTAHKIGEVKTVYLSLGGQAVIMFLASYLVTSTASYYLFGALAGFFFGACMVIYSSSVSRFFGVERLGQIYPLLFASNYFGGLLPPPYAGYIFDKTGSYSIAFYSAGVILIVGIVLFGILFRVPNQNSDTPPG